MLDNLTDRDSWGAVLIAGGCDPGPPPRLCPDDIVTRASMAILLSRAFAILRE